MSYVRPIDNSRLICKLIKSRPELYDPEHPDYSNRPIHGKIWKELADKMGVGVEEFRSKWASMRNSYARCVKAKQEHPNRTRVKWYLEDHMDFLQKHIMNRTKRRNFLEHFSNANIEETDKIITESQKIRNDSAFDEESRSTYEDRNNSNPDRNNKIKENDKFDQLDEIFDNNCDKKSESIENNCEKSRRKRKIKHSSSSSSSTTAEFDRLINSVAGFFDSQTLQLKQQPDDLFFQSIEKDYEKLTDKKRRKFKLTVLNALNDLLDEVD